MSASSPYLPIIITGKPEPIGSGGGSLPKPLSPLAKQRAEATGLGSATAKAAQDALKKSQAETAARAKAQAEAQAKAKAERDAQAAKFKRESDERAKQIKEHDAMVAAKAKAQVDAFNKMQAAAKAKAAADAKTKAQAEAQARAAAEAAAKAKAETDARAAAEAAAKAKAEADARAAAEAAAKAKAEADARAAAEAAAKAKAEADARAAAEAAAKAKAEADTRAAAEAAAKAKAEADARAAAEASAKAEADARAAAKEKAEADARAAAAKAQAEAEAQERQNWASLQSVMDVTPVPVYTADMVHKAESAMVQPGVMALPFLPRMMNLAVAGEGFVPVTPEVNVLIGNTLIRASTALSEWAMAAETAVSAATTSVLVATFWSTEAGKGSDKVPGRDMDALFATQSNLLTYGMDNSEGIRPGMDSVELPVRASLVEENGRLALRLLKTGTGGLPATVRILTAIRDPETGLDKIIVPGPGEGYYREVLVNPSSDGMPAEWFPGHGDVLPQTPVSHDVSVVPAVADMDDSLQIETIQPPTTLQDFIYWQVFPDGSSARPVYVVMASDKTKLNKETATQFSAIREGVITDSPDVIDYLSRTTEKLLASAYGVIAASEGVLASSALTASVVVTGFWPGGAGVHGDDKVPDRDMGALFAVPAETFTAGQQLSTSGDNETAYLPVRGSLIEDNGQLALRLLSAGLGEPTREVRVLKAVRDKATGLDVITLPAVAGEPSKTILINPVQEPLFPSDTGSPAPLPVIPAHTGTDVTPVEDIVVTVTPVPDEDELLDFIYWQPDAEGTGVTPIYVMLSGIYGETNAKGKYSGRDYNTDKAGGPVQELDWKTTTIDREGVDKVKLHTGRFEETPENVVMIDRLEKILKGDIQITDTDKRYYTHEIRELERYRNLGIKDGEVPQNKAEVWNNTHTATLEDYQLSSDETLLYTPEALYSQE